MLARVAVCVRALHSGTCKEWNKRADTHTNTRGRTAARIYVYMYTSSPTEAAVHVPKVVQELPLEAELVFIHAQTTFLEFVAGFRQRIPFYSGSCR